MLETIILAVLVAKFKKYNIKYVLKNWAIYPIIFFEIIYFIFQIMIFTENYQIVQLMQSFKSIYLSIYLLLVFKYEIYTTAIIGSISVMIGGLLNDIAIKANNGFMPVFPSLSYWTGYIKLDTFKKVKDIHILGDSATKFKVLTDYIDLGYSILSIGDIFVRVFVFIVIYESIKKVID